MFFSGPRDGDGRGGGSEDARGGGEGVRSEGKEICYDIENTSFIRHHPNDVGGACESDYIHQQSHT